MKNFEDIQIAVAGTGYVGLSIATVLAWMIWRIRFIRGIFLGEINR